MQGTIEHHLTRLGALLWAGVVCLAFFDPTSDTQRDNLARAIERVFVFLPYLSL